MSELSYPVNPPFAYVHVAGGRYVVQEPELSPHEQRVLCEVKKRLLKEASKASSIDEGWLDRALAKLARKLPEDLRLKVSYYVKRDALGYGKLDPLLRDPELEDISVVRGRVYVYHRRYGSLETNVELSEDEARSLALRLAYRCGGHVSSSRPVFSGRLPEGHRVHIVLREVCEGGTAIDVRKHRSAVELSLLDLIRMGTLTPELAAYLWLLLEAKRGVIFTGRTGAGKTTTLNAVASLIPPSAKVVTVEEVRELWLPHRQWVALVTRDSVDGRLSLSLFDLVKEALRQRPDYLIVGEVRGEEAYTLFQAMATGHGGLSTIHADSPQAAVRRLTMEPMNIPRDVIESTVGALVHLDFVDGSRRVVEVASPTGERLYAIGEGLKVDLQRLAEQVRRPLEQVEEALRSRAKLLADLAAEGGSFDRLLEALGGARP